MSFLTKIFGSSNQRALKRMQVLVDQINLLEVEYSNLNDAEFVLLRARLKGSYQNDVGQLLPHAFAAVREASIRATGMS